jgi:uncharacterized protein YabN with tetrapyrrole methylase and pyrophosphatase domain
MKPGSLTIVGTGIKLVAHVTLEAEAHIRQATKLLYLVADPVTEAWLIERNSTAESLQRCYGDGKPRMQSYVEMVEMILSHVREGKRVCAAFYGHPGVFVYPSHEAIRRARAEGFSGSMLPGISAEDCLFADLGIDPSAHGCQSFEATDFLIFERKHDPRSLLVLWQIGLVGQVDFKRAGYSTTDVGLLIDRLLETYSNTHEVIVYEASQYPVCEPRAERIPLADLRSIRLTPISTLVVPILTQAKANKDLVAQLKLTHMTQS